MAKDINEIIEEIRRLDDQLEAYWDTLRSQFHYSLKGKKIQFEEAANRAHKRFRTGLLGYILRAPLSHLVTAPIIYSMIIPLCLLDLFLLIYQHTCFRAYGIKRVDRRDYIVIDRHRLSYLNGLEKLNCVYCGYGNGLIAYSREIIARTEQYWCPIKHARKSRGKHGRYYRFAEYGDAENYRKQLLELREDLTAENHRLGAISIRMASYKPLIFSMPQRLQT